MEIVLLAVVGTVAPCRRRSLLISFINVGTDERKGVLLMMYVTYDNLYQFVIMMCAVIALVLKLKHKK